MSKCSAENLSVNTASTNRIQTAGYVYDAAGNMTNDGLGHTYTYDGDGRITQMNSGAASYTYLPNGQRLRKDISGGPSTEYLYFGDEIVAELNPSTGGWTNYVFFNSERVARHDPGGGVFYYFSDHLKTAAVVTDAAGNIKDESDYYPWGGELQFANFNDNHYKFTGKERDSETGLDYFGARYYSNILGRFISADWSEIPEPVPYADLGDPQSLNLYSYVRNIPTTNADPDGHCCSLGQIGDFIAGVANAVHSNATLGANRVNGGSTAFKNGQVVGDGLSLVMGTVETASGVQVAAGGVAACTSGAGCVVGGGAVVAGTTVAAHGIGTSATALTHLMSKDNSGTGSGSSPQSGENTSPGEDPKGGTYTLTDPKTGEVQYVGRSSDLNRRAAEHGRSGDKGNLKFNVDKRTDNYAAQRGREQILYDKHKPPMNKRQPISPNNPNRKKYMKAGQALGD